MSTRTRTTTAEVFPARVAEWIRAIETGRLDHFRTLGVPRNAATAAVHAAYHRRIREFHPDRLAALGLAELRSDVTRIFMRIREAYGVLSDEAQRRVYLEALEAGTSGDVPPSAAGASVAQLIQAELEFKKGMAFLRRNDYSAAASQFEQAVRLNSAEGAHHGYHAWAVFSDPRTERTQERFRAIKTELMHACELAPHDAQLFYFLGRVLEANGEQAQAYRAYQTVLAMDPHHLEAQREVRLERMRADRGNSGITGFFKRIGATVTRPGGVKPPRR